MTIPKAASAGKPDTFILMASMLQAGFPPCCLRQPAVCLAGSSARARRGRGCSLQWPCVDEADAAVFTRAQHLNRYRGPAARSQDHPPCQSPRQRISVDSPPGSQACGHSASLQYAARDDTGSASAPCRFHRERAPQPTGRQPKGWTRGRRVLPYQDPKRETGTPRAGNSLGADRRGPCHAHPPAPRPESHQMSTPRVGCGQGTTGAPWCLPPLPNTSPLQAVHGSMAWPCIPAHRGNWWAITSTSTPPRSENAGIAFQADSVKRSTLSQSSSTPRPGPFGVGSTP